jgi:uncharacterized small protein (DUF1192 family)
MKLKGLACFVPGLMADHKESKSDGDLASLSIEELEALIEERFRAALKQEISRFQARKADRCIQSAYLYVIVNMPTGEWITHGSTCAGRPPPEQGNMF